MSKTPVIIHADYQLPDSLEVNHMSKTPFTIHPDGSLRHENCILDAKATQRLYQYLTEDRLRLHGHAVTPLSLTIGCVHVGYSEVQAFIDAYGSGEWRRSVEKTYRQGARLKYNDEHYILARAGQNKFALINLQNGNHWAGPFEVEDENGIKLSELMDDDFISKFKEM